MSLKQSFREPFIVESIRLQVSLGIGVSECLTGDDLERVIRDSGRQRPKQKIHPSFPAGS